ncbi:MAG TPA: tetratricopeptide repeat protein, partial [Xanthomonadales bacterium]|nr:tetratricopeptide repeat protein [Xanthomonadales bacterium]
MIEEALQHLKSGNYAAAEVLYRQMLAEEPENPEVLYMLAISRQGQNDLDAPLELLNQALRVQPKNPTLHHTLGMIQL